MHGEQARHIALRIRLSDHIVDGGAVQVADGRAA